MGPTVDKRLCGVPWPTNAGAGWFSVVLAACACGAAAAGTPEANEARPGDMELHATFSCLGVSVTCLGQDARHDTSPMWHQRPRGQFPAGDPNKNSSARVEYRKVGDKDFRQGFPLARIGDSFIGSLFWLETGTAYEVHVTLKDPDAGGIDGKVFTGTCSTRKETAMPEPKRQIFVRPSNKSNAAQNSPSELAKAIAAARPGDHVILRGGVYHVGEIAVEKSGTEDAPIVIRGHPGEEAILDGSDPAGFKPEWTRDSDNIYSAPLDERIKDAYLIVLEDRKRLLRYGGALADPNPMHTAKAFEYFQTNARKLDAFFIAPAKKLLYVNLHGADPGKARLAISRYTNGFAVNGASYVYFKDLTFRYYHTVDAALKFTHSSCCRVEKCKFHINDTDVHIGSGAKDLLIQDNDSDGGKVNWDLGAMKEAWQFEVSGFRGRGSSCGTVIRRNVLRNHGDGLGLMPSSNTDMHDNLVQDCADDGVEVDSAVCNVRIWGNTFRRCYRGISLSPARHGPVYCIRNVCHGGPKGWNLFKIQARGARGPMYLLHNTSYAAGGLNPCGAKGVLTWDCLYSRNNLYYTTSSGRWGAGLVVDTASGPVDMDYDNYFRAARDPLGQWNGGDAKTLAELQAASGQQKHGLSADPKFLDPAEGQFTLQPGSPMIDAGVHIPGINDDYKGKAPDVGAFECDTGK